MQAFLVHFFVALIALTFLHGFAMEHTSIDYIEPPVNTALACLPNQVLNQNNTQTTTNTTLMTITEEDETKETQTVDLEGKEEKKQQTQSAAPEPVAPLNAVDKGITRIQILMHNKLATSLRNDAFMGRAYEIKGETPRIPSSHQHQRRPSHHNIESIHNSCCCCTKQACQIIAITVLLAGVISMVIYLACN